MHQRTSAWRSACAGRRAFPGVDRQDRCAPRFRRDTLGVSMAQPVVRSAMQPEVEHLGSAAERERHDVVDLQPIAGTAAPPAVVVDIAATTLVAPPHLPLHRYRNVPRAGARQLVAAAQRGEVPLQSRRTLRRPHHTMPGGVHQPLGRRSRAPAAASHRRPRRIAPVGFEPRSGGARRTVQDTSYPRVAAIAVRPPVPLRLRSSPTAAAVHRLRLRA